MKRGIIEQPISLKLFAHINNDAHLVGQTYLEGQSLSETSEFLADFIRVMSHTHYMPAEISQRLIKSGLEAKVGKLSVLFNEINEGRFVPNSVAREILKISNDSADDSVFFPGGWNACRNSDQSGHAMVYEFRKDQKGNLIFLIYNSGAGLNHHIQIPSQDKVRYLPVKAYQIPKSDVTEENIVFLLNQLVKPRVEPLQSNKFYNQENVYREVIPRVALLGGVEIDPRSISSVFNEVNTMGQRSGTCAEKVLHQLLKETFQDKKDLKKFMFYFKKYTIESYLRSGHPFTQDDVQQIKLAIENLARIIKKNPGYFSAEEISEAHKFIDSSERHLGSDVEDIHASPIPDFIPVDIEALKIPTPIQGANLAPPLEFIPASKAAVVSGYYHDKLSITNEVHSRPLIEVLNSFSNEINRIIVSAKSQNPNLFVKEQIENLLLAIPLESEYYSRIKDSSEALEVLNRLTELLQLYVESCSKVDLKYKLNITSLVALMSGFSIVHQLTILPKVTIKGCGIAGVLMNNSYSSMVFTLMNTHLCLSMNPSMHQRLKEIASINYHQEAHLTKGIDFYKMFLKKEANREFNSKLKKLYKAQKGRLKSGRAYNSLDSIIDQNKLTIEVAFVLFLNESTCSSKFSKYLIKHKVEKAAVNIAYQLSSLMSGKYPFDADKLNDEDNFWIKEVDLDIFGRKTIDYNPKHGIKGGADAFELSSYYVLESLRNEDLALENDYIKAAFYYSDAKIEHDHWRKLSNALSENERKSLEILYHPNAIYSYKYTPNTKSVEPVGQTDEERAISKMLWSLRTTKSTQIVSSLDFFYSNMELLNDKDYQSYLVKNIFQVDLLLNGLVSNKELYNIVDNFIEYGKNYYNQPERKGNAFFYKLQFDFHHFVLGSGLESYYEHSTKSLIDLNWIVNGMLHKDNVSPEDRLWLLSLKIKTSLDILKDTESEMGELIQLFSEFLEFKALSADLDIRNPSVKNNEIEIQKNIIDFFKKREKGISIMLLSWLQDNGIRVDNQKVKTVVKFPKVTITDSINRIQVNLDLTDGIVQIIRESDKVNQFVIRKTPLNLLNSSLYQKFYDYSIHDTKIYKSSKVGDIPIIQSIEIVNDPHKGRFLETPTLGSGYVYQCVKLVNGQEYKFEYQHLADSYEPESVVTSLLGAQGSQFILPKSFFCETTCFWVGEENITAIFEREDRTYSFDYNSNTIEELEIRISEDGEKQYINTGYRLLIHTDNEQGRVQESVDNLYKIFTHFEDKSFIEILLADPLKENEPDLKICFPRYNLVLHGRQDPNTKKWHISLSDNADLELQVNSLPPFDGFQAPLMFQHINTKQIFGLVPNQEFYVSKSQYKAANKAFDLIFDIHNVVRRADINEENPDAENDVPGNVRADGPWKYVGTESYYTFPVDELTKKFEPQTTEEALYLTYIALVQKEPELALRYIKDNIIAHGGLKGTQKELELIEKILHGVPRYPEKLKIENPSVLAIQMQTLSLVAHFKSKGGDFNLPTAIPTELSKYSSYMRLKRNKLARFLSELEKATPYFYVLNKYHHTKQNIPSRLQLSENQEYELLLEIFKREPLKGPLGVRFKELQDHQFALEQSAIAGLNVVPNILNQRLNEIESKIKKPKIVQFEESQIVDRDILVNIEGKISGFDLFEESAETLLLPTPPMSDAEFVQQFFNYYKIAKSSKYPFEKSVLKEYCHRVILSYKDIAQKEREGIQSQILPLAQILLFVMEYPANFPTIKKMDKRELREFMSRVLDAVVKSGRVSFPSKSLQTTTVEIPIHSRIKEGSLIPHRRIQVDERKYDEIKYNEKIDQFIMILRNEKTKADAEIEKLLSSYDDEAAFHEQHIAKLILDERIGQIRNKYSAFVRDYASNSSDLIENIPFIIEHTSKNVNKIKQTLIAKELEILSLSNQGPSDEQGKLLFNLEHFGKTRSKLKLPDLLRLYLLADELEYHRITGLDSKDIIRLHELLSDYVQHSILNNTYEQIQSNAISVQKELAIQNAERPIAALEKLANNLAQINFAKVNDTQIQLFQMLDKKLLFKQQKHYLDVLLKGNDKVEASGNEVIQLIMGGGKSKVLAPLLALQKADGVDLPIIQVKNSLFHTNLADLNETSMKLFNQEAIPLEFNRDSPCHSRDLKAIYNKLLQVITNRQYLVTTGESLQSLELKYLEILNSPSEDSVEWKKEIKWLDRILKLIKYRGNRIIDEVHDELDPIKELNYTMDAVDSIPKVDISLEMNLFRFFSKIKFGKITVSDVAINSKIIKPDEWDNLFENIARQLVNDANSPIGKTISLLKLNKAQKNDFVAYLLDKSDKILETFAPLSIQEKDEIAFLKMQISEILPFTFKKDLNENYGPSRSGKISEIERMLPIPYRAGEPNEQSRFGNYIELMNYTIQMAMQTALSDEVVRNVLLDICSKAEIEMLEDPNLRFEQTIAGLEFNSCIRLAFDFKRVQADDREYISSLIDDLKNSDNFKDYTLERYVLPKIKTHPSVLSSNSANSAAMTRTTQGMTGTPYNVLAMHQDLHFNQKEGLGTDGETINLIKDKKTQVHVLGNDNEPFEMLKIKNDYLRAIIDVGGLFRGISNEEVVKALADNNDSLKYILYFSTAENTLYALDTQSRKVIPLNSTDEAKINEVLKCTPNERFTYYDQPHTVGVDVTQTEKAHALVTLSEKTMQHSLLQGVLRMRQFARQQNVTFVLPKYMTLHLNNSKPTYEDILTFVSKNSSGILLGTHLKGAHQRFSNLLREILLRKIYNEPNLELKVKLFHESERFFTRAYRPSHFASAGGVRSSIRSDIYFEEMRNNYIALWNELRIKVNLNLEDERYFISSLDKIMHLSILACDESIPRRKSSDQLSAIMELGSEVEVQTAIEQQLENEMEQELEKQQMEYDPSVIPSNIPNLTFEGDIRKGQPAVLSLNNMPYFIGQQPTFSFSQCLYMTQQFAKTHKSQNQYFGPYTKPIEIIMMVQSKKPPYALDAVIMTKLEADDLFVKKSINDYHIWFTTPRDLVYAGTKPVHLSPDYGVVLEQIRYLNGDCQLLAQQSELYWVNQDSYTKLDYLYATILLCHPNKIALYENLRLRLDVTSKILRTIINNPFVNYASFDWSSTIHEFNKLPESKKALISNVSLALNHVLFELRKNQRFFDTNDYATFKKGFDPEVIYYIELVKVNLVDTLALNEYMLQKKPLYLFNGNIRDFGVFNHAGQLPIHYALSLGNIEDIKFLLSKNVSLDVRDKAGKSIIDYLGKLKEKNSRLAGEAEHLLAIAGFKTPDYSNQVKYCVMLEKNIKAGLPFDQFDKDLIRHLTLDDLNYFQTSTGDSLLLYAMKVMPPKEYVKFADTLGVKPDAKYGLILNAIENKKMKDDELILQRDIIYNPADPMLLERAILLGNDNLITNAFGLYKESFHSDLDKIKPIICAIKMGNLEWTRILYETLLPPLDLKDEMGKNLKSYALETHRMSFINYILEKVDSVDLSAYVVPELFDLGYSNDGLLFYINWINTLFEAVTEGDSAKLSTFLGHQPDVGKVGFLVLNDKNKTLFDIALKNGRHDMAKLLFEHWVNKLVRNSNSLFEVDRQNRTIWEVASEFGYFEMLRPLFQKRDASGLTPLQWAISKGDQDLIKKLGGNPNAYPQRVKPISFSEAESSHRSVWPSLPPSAPPPPPTTAPRREQESPKSSEVAGSSGSDGSDPLSPPSFTPPRPPEGTPSRAGKSVESQPRFESEDWVPSLPPDPPPSPPKVSFQRRSAKRSESLESFPLPPRSPEASPSRSDERRKEGELEQPYVKPSKPPKK